MLGPTEKAPAEVAFSECNAAYRSGDYAACIRHSARVLALAEDDPLLAARVCWMRGGIEEMRGRRGLALRIWSYGCELARAAGLRSSEIHGLLERSIASLLDWPRVLLSHASADAATAETVRGALESHGLQCLACEPGGEAPAAGQTSLLGCLDRVTVLFVLWSRAYSRSARQLAELNAARGRLAIWRRLGTVPRSLFVRVDGTPIPRRFQEFEIIDLGVELDASAAARLAGLVRHPDSSAAQQALTAH